VAKLDKSLGSVFVIALAQPLLLARHSTRERRLSGMRGANFVNRRWPEGTDSTHARMTQTRGSNPLQQKPLARFHEPSLVAAGGPSSVVDKLAKAIWAGDRVQDIGRAVNVNPFP
jgi:hypothetical protein